MTIQESTQMLSKEASVTLLTDMLKQAEEDKKELRDALRDLALFADSVIGEPDKARISYEYGNKLIKQARAAIAATS